MAGVNKNLFHKLYNRLYHFTDSIKFTNKLKVIFAVVLLLLISSSVLSVVYLNDIKVFNEQTATSYLNCMNLAHRLEVLVTNEESLLSKYFLSSANTQTYLFALRQNHHELKQVINELEQYSFDENFREIVAMLKSHEVEADQMLEGLWRGSNQPHYESILSDYSFIKNTSIEISNYASVRYDGVRFTATKLVKNSIVIISAMSLIFLSILISCYMLLHKLSTNLEVKSVRDPLTGLYNRRVLDEKLNQLATVQEYHQISFSLIMIDLDNFKQINDTYGHQSGDKILVDVAALFNSVARPGDYLTRYGGEEIALLLVDTRLRKAHLIAEHLRRLVENHIFIAENGSPINLTISLGVAENGHDLDIVKEADAALYKSKYNGRNQVTISERCGLDPLQVDYGEYEAPA